MPCCEQHRRDIDEQATARSAGRELAKLLAQQRSDERGLDLPRGVESCIASQHPNSVPFQL